MTGYYENVVNLTGGGEAERVPVAMVTRDFFTTLGARPILRRTFAFLSASMQPVP